MKVVDTRLSQVMFKLLPYPSGLARNNLLTHIAPSYNRGLTLCVCDKLPKCCLNRSLSSWECILSKLDSVVAFKSRPDSSTCNCSVVLLETCSGYLHHDTSLSLQSASWSEKKSCFSWLLQQLWSLLISSLSCSAISHHL